MKAARYAALALAVAAASSCSAEGETCGRGRCAVGERCISIFGAGRENQGWRKERQPNVDGEWWCERACPAGRACAGGCLQDPADDEVVVCAVDQVTLQYHSSSSSCLCPAGGGICPSGMPVQSIDIIDGCTAGSPVISSCVSGVDCPVGPLRSGDTVPGVTLHGTDGTPAYSFSICPGRPENVLGPALPEGVTVRVWVDLDACR